MVETAIDHMRTSGAPTNVILVGGGSVLVDRKLAGAADTFRPEHAGVANAIGAAIGQVGGRVDKLYDFSADGRDAAIGKAVEEAKRMAVDAGANPETTELVDLEELPMTHLQSSAVRVKVKVAGDLL